MIYCLLEVKRVSLVEEKVSQAIEILNEVDIDVWLTYVRKTSEIPDPSLPFLLNKQFLTWETAIILSQEGKKIAICGRYDVPNIEAVDVYQKIISYDESIKTSLQNTLYSLNPSSIAVNYSQDNVAADGLTHGMWKKLQSMLKETQLLEQLTSSEPIISKLRGRKTATELERTKKSVRISQEGHTKLTNFITLGTTEQEIEEWLIDYTSSHNVTVAYPPLINVGPDTTIGHADPTPGVHISRGDLINLDYGVFYKGYASDIQRMHYVLQEQEENPPEKVQNAFNTLIQAIDKAAEALHPGIQGWKIDQIARNIVTEAGYNEFKHATGHQIGRNVHDGGCLLGPQWERYGEQPYAPVEAGQIFTLEPTVFLEGYGFCGIEEDILVTREGCRFLSDRQLELNTLSL